MIKNKHDIGIHHTCNKSSRNCHCVADMKVQVKEVSFLQVHKPSYGHVCEGDKGEELAHHCCTVSMLYPMGELSRI
jgi:hypothetical protein